MTADVPSLHPPRSPWWRRLMPRRGGAGGPGDMLVQHSRIPVGRIITEGMLPSRLKVALYRARGARIGRGVQIAPGAVLVAEELQIGDHTSIGFGTVLRGRSIRLGRHVRIGSTTFLDVEKIVVDDDAKINEQVFAGGPTLPESYLHVGRRCIIMQHTFLNPTKPLIIEDGAGVGGKCSIFTHGSWQSTLEGYPVKFAPVRIGKNVWIPWQVFIMPGVSIGDGATIGAASLVTKDIPAGALAAGVPAKVLKTADEYPVRPDADARRASLEAVLDEFWGYLEYFGHSVRRSESGGASERIEVSGPRGVHRLLYRGVDSGSRAAGPTGPDTVVLSLPPISEEDRNAFRETGAPWIDVGAAERSDLTNSLMEELVAFLGRYGIRFDRVL